MKYVIKLNPQQIRYLENQGLSQKKIARFCQVDPRSIRRWKHEPFSKRKQKVGRKPKVPFKDFISLMIHVFKGNKLTQQEMADYLLKEKGLGVSRKSISRYLRKHGITSKKINYHYADQLKHKDKIKLFLEKTKPLLSIYPFFALDECSFHLNEVPRRNYALKGFRSNSLKPSQKGKNHTLILCIQNAASKGVIHYELIEGGMKTKNFHEFLTNLKLPTNEKNCLLLDNLRVHHAKKIKELLISKNIETIFLVPYSPELNPVELCFNFIRSQVENRRPKTFEELKLAIDEAVALLQEKDLTKYFRHCFEYFEKEEELTKKTPWMSNGNFASHYYPQLVRLFKRQLFENPKNGTLERNHPKIRYIDMRKKLRQSGQSIRAL